MATSRRLAVALIGVLCAALSSNAGCISAVSLDNRPCPCATGYTCCEATRTCMTATQICRSTSPADGGASGAGAGAGGTESPGKGGAAGAPNPSGGAGTGGQAGGGSGAGGSAGSPSEPSWQPVGADEIDTPQPTNSINMAIAPDGTIYVAFRGCEPCSPEASSEPFVARHAGEWQMLSTEGLPGTVKGSPAPAVDELGNLFVLTEQGVFSFDGAAWVSVSEVPPFPVSDEATLERDEQGRFYTTLFDIEQQQIRVVRLESGSFQAVGSPVLSQSNSVRLEVVGSEVYLAHPRFDFDVTNVFIRRFDGADWELLQGYEGGSIGIAASSDGTVFAGIEDAAQRSALLVRGDGTGWTELGTLTSSWTAPAFEIAPSGTLYLTFLVEDFVNVNYLDDEGLHDLDSLDIGNTGLLPSLRITEAAGTDVPHLAILGGSRVRVIKYQ